MCMSWGMGIKTACKDRVRSNNGQWHEREDRRERKRERERERKQVQEIICPPKMRKRWKDAAAPPSPADRKRMYLNRLGWTRARTKPVPQPRAPRPPRPHTGSSTFISWISSLLRSGFASPSRRYRTALSRRGVFAASASGFGNVGLIDVDLELVLAVYRRSEGSKGLGRWHKEHWELVHNRFDETIAGGERKFDPSAQPLRSLLLPATTMSALYPTGLAALPATLPPSPTPKFTESLQPPLVDPTSRRPLTLAMFGLGLALKPGLGLGFSGLWLEVCQARAQARRQGLAWLGLGLSPGLMAIFFGPHEGAQPRTYPSGERFSRKTVGNTSGKFICQSQGLKPWLWLYQPQAKAQAPHQALNLAWLGLQSQGFGFRASGLQAKPSTSLIDTLKSVFGFWLSSRKCVYTFHPLVMPGVFSTTLRLGYLGGSNFVKTRIPPPSYLLWFANCNLQPEVFTSNKLFQLGLLFCLTGSDLEIPNIRHPSTKRPSAFSPASSEGPGPTSDPADLDDGTGRSSSPSEGHTNNPCKRPAEDLAQCVERTAWNLCLKLESTEALKTYSELPAAEQSIWLAGRISLHDEILGTLQPPEAIYHIPGDLECTIDQYHFLVMIDLNASMYVKKGKASPISRLTGHLLRIPNCGLTPALTYDKSKMNVIEGRMRYKFTHSRNLIKDLVNLDRRRFFFTADVGQIVKSVGDPDTEDESGQPMDIITLCQRVIDLGSSKLTTDIKVSVEMCGRFAFLALAMPSEKKDGGVRKTDFWGSVDKNLEELRESKNRDKVRISTCQHIQCTPQQISSRISGGCHHEFSWGCATSHHGSAFGSKQAETFDA
ncbi:hypothetical protein DFH08DRAFT_815110 [Mycena albidolilacea]|uniref:Uncharacterized protein n=1 Tax=Mycena albidolilacea TaxID=1033008 RepID=A0AAD6ZP94_9AGAR|nr:hypothetical protein DFH08DRAFT_815110 [Mycena albidolilacea]